MAAADGSELTAKAPVAAAAGSFAQFADGGRRRTDSLGRLADFKNET